MSQLDPRDIVTINLKYGSAARPLRALAFAQLAAKVLFLAGKPIGTPEICDRIAQALGVGKVSRTSVETGLTLLREVAKARQAPLGGSSDKKLWELTAQALDEIRNDVDRSHGALEAVLGRHFPGDLDRTALRSWFNEAAARVFGQYGDEWVAAVCRGSHQGVRRPESLRQMMSPITKRHRLGDRSESLVDGFLGFLKSDDLADQQYLMSLGQAMFSARLVAADIGADPITLDEFREAIVLLDTNLIFAIVLEDHRVAKSVRALAQALKRIGAKPMFLRPTQEEYERAVAGVRSNLLPIVESLPEQVLAGAQNDFIATAQARGCKTRADYETFFETMTFPGRIADQVDITLLEYPEIVATIKLAERDEPLKRRVQALALSMRPEWRRKKKSPASLEHDASLVHVAEGERKLKSKAWVLSLDRSLQACAVERAGPHALPAVLSVDALVEILAADGAGPGIDPSDFAPLLARIILNECAPPANTYAVEDLRWLLTINEAVAELSADDTKELAMMVMKARVEGKSVGDPQLQLQVNRAFQVKRQETEERVRAAQERAAAAEGVAARERRERERAQDELAKERALAIVRRARWRLGRRLAGRVAASAAGSVLLGLLLLWIAPDWKPRSLTGTGLGVVGFAVAMWRWSLKPISEYRDEVRGAERSARASILHPD